MASAILGSTRKVSWHHGGTALLPRACTPLFAANDIGDTPYRAIHDAARRLWRDHGTDAPFVAASRAQGAFWQGRMDACRWWHSVGRMLDRALVAGSIGLVQHIEPDTSTGPRQVPVNS